MMSTESSEQHPTRRRVPVGAWLRGVIDLLFGFDFFISYAHKDGTKYPNRLAERLQETHFKTFLDTQVYVSGEDLVAGTGRRVRMSTYLIVVARPYALQSPWVLAEIQQCLSAKRTPIVIDVNQTFQNAGEDVAIKRLLRDRLYIPENLDDPLDSEPTNEVLERLRKSFTSVRRESQLLRVVSVAALVLMLVATVAVWQYLVAKRQARIALSRQLAAQAVSYAGNQFDLALLLSLEANRLTETPEIRGSLLAVLETSPHLITFLRAHSGRVERVTFNPDSSRNMLASVGGDGQLILWDVTAHQPRDPLRARTRFVISVAFSPDGTLLALGHDDGTITLWNVATRQPVSQPLTGHKGPVSSITFSPDGHTLASSSWDTTIILWDVATRKRLAPPLTGDPSPVESTSFSPDSTILASGYKDTGTIILWDVARHQQVGPPLTGHRGSTVTSVAFSPDGNTLASGAKDDTIILWDVSVQRAFISSTQTPTRKGPPSVVLSPPRSRTLTGHKNWVFSVAFSPDGKTLASGAWDNTVILWDVASGEPMGPPLKGHTAQVMSVAFSPDGKTLASGSRDNTIILWEVMKPRTLIVPPRTFGPKIPWGTAAGTPQGKSLTNYASFVTSIAFSPDGHMIAAGTGDHTVLLWDVPTLQLLDPPLEGHTATVWAVAFSPDGKTLASGSHDGEILLWDVASRQLLRPALVKHTELVRGIAFSPDGTVLASGSRDGYLMLWDITTHQLLERTQHLVPPPR